MIFHGFFIILSSPPPAAVFGAQLMAVELRDRSEDVGNLGGDMASFAGGEADGFPMVKLFRNP